MMQEEFDEIMLKALRLRLKYFLAALESVRENPSCKNTHSLSTSLRRILTCDRIVGDLLDKNLLNKKVSQPIKRLRKILTAARDAQEMPLKFKEISGPENRWRKVGFKLEKNEKEATGKLINAVDKFREELIKKSFNRKRLGRICAEKLVIAPGDYIREQFSEALELYPQAVENSDDRMLHKLRVRYKYFRYSVEALAPVVGFSDLELDWLREFQTAMGDAHDWLVLSEFVTEATDGKNKYAPCRELIEEKLHINNHQARVYLRENINKLNDRIEKLP